MSVVIETTIGDLTVDLYCEERPQACKNFLKLCKLKYFNFNLFHSIQRGFIAQTGDPTGTGRGGESLFGIHYGEQARYFEAEKVPRIKHSKKGAVSMVNYGNNMLGSQFFFTLDPDLNYLDEEHCVFGEVTEGMEVIDKFNDVICDDDHRPYKDVRVTHTVILDDPFDDPPGLEFPRRSPSPTAERIDSGRIRADEEVEDFKHKTVEEIEEIIKEKEAKAQATILEMIGDLPEADIAPPENVLFVCKLNPVTSDDDLEIIFSRFGKVNSCEVIRDHKSGESLQYAFIEFEDRKACEDAYFKMDNVLIDDRRIHVDFSQSVAKYQWKGKGRGVVVQNNEKSDSHIVRGRGRNNDATKTSSYPSSTANRNDRQNHYGKEYDSVKYSTANESLSSRKQFSTSPPRYSRIHETEQKREEKSKGDKTDEKLIEFLRNELHKSKKKKESSKKKKKKKQESSIGRTRDSSNSSSNSDSSYSSSEDASKSQRKKRKHQH